MFIKSFIEYYKINESVYNGLLYHGSPYRFFEFDDKVTFLSKTKKFAIEYSNQKSLDFGMDNDTNIYTVRCKTDFFNIHDEKCENDLIRVLPNMISFTYNNFGFNTEVSRDEIILNMKGYHTIYPFEDVINAKVGDKIPSPEYRGDLYYVYKRDEDYLYTINYKLLSRKLDFDKILNGHNDVYKPLKNIIERVARKDSDYKYLSDNHLHLYFIVLSDKKLSSSYGVSEPSDDDIKEFNYEYDKLMKNLIDEMVSKGYTKRYTLKTILQESKDSWRYYENETVYNSLIQLGYGGYVAKEDGVDTYAVFNPRKDLEIIEYEFPIGFKFKNKKEYDDFSSFKKELYTFMKNDGFFDSNKYKHIDDYMLYDSWKSKFSIEQTYEEINK